MGQTLMSKCSHGSLTPCLIWLARLGAHRGALHGNDDKMARAEAAELHGAVVTKKDALHGYVVRIVSSRSKPQLKATFERYKQEHGKAIDKVQFLSPSCTVCMIIHLTVAIFSVTLIPRFSAMLKTVVWC
jgi:hypothetical protein